VIALLVQKVPASAVCTRLGLCKSDEIELVESVSSLECPVCEWIMGEVEKYVTGNSTEQEIVQVIEKVCKIIPSSYRAIVCAHA
jgi:hypothetical protein